MNDDIKNIYELAGEEITVWVDGGIHIKTRNKYGDSVELGEDEAMELAMLLIDLVGGDPGSASYLRVSEELSEMMAKRVV